MHSPSPDLIMEQQYSSDPGRSSQQSTVQFLTAAGIGTSLLVLSGFLLTVTVIVVVVATPVMIIFSPVLVPAGAVTLLAAAGLVVSGGFGVAAVSALAWIYNYVGEENPVGAEKVDKLRAMIAERTKNYGHYMQTKGQEVIIS